MNKEIITLGKIEKHKFHYHKNPVLMDDVDIDKILISNKVFVGTIVLVALLVREMMKKLSHYV